MIKMFTLLPVLQHFSCSSKRTGFPPLLTQIFLFFNFSTLPWKLVFPRGSGNRLSDHGPAVWNNGEELGCALRAWWKAAWEAWRPRGAGPPSWARRATWAEATAGESRQNPCAGPSCPPGLHLCAPWQWLSPWRFMFLHVSWGLSCSAVSRPVPCTLADFCGVPASHASPAQKPLATCSHAAPLPPAFSPIPPLGVGARLSSVKSWRVRTAVTFQHGRTANAIQNLQRGQNLKLMASCRYHGVHQRKEDLKAENQPTFHPEKIMSHHFLMQPNK